MIKFTDDTPELFVVPTHVGEIVAFGQFPEDKPCKQSLNEVIRHYFILLQATAKDFDSPKGQDAIGTLLRDNAKGDVSGHFSMEYMPQYDLYRIKPAKKDGEFFLFAISVLQTHFIREKIKDADSILRERARDAKNKQNRQMRAKIKSRATKP